MERVMGFEPTTSTLATWCSTPELHPRGAEHLTDRWRASTMFLGSEWQHGDGGGQSAGIGHHNLPDGFSLCPAVSPATFGLRSRGQTRPARGLRLCARKSPSSLPY